MNSLYIRMFLICRVVLLINITLLCFKAFSSSESEFSCFLSINKNFDFGENAIQIPQFGDPYVLAEDYVQNFIEIQELKSTPNDKGLDLSSASIVHVFDFENTMEILSNGSLSYAEVISLRNVPYNRLIADPRSMNLSLDYSIPLHRQFLPKFAYLVLPQRKKADGFGRDVPRLIGHHYGEIMAILKPEVKKRTLWQVANRGRFRNLEQGPSKNEISSSPHLEAAIFGPLTRADIEVLVIKELNYRRIIKSDPQKWEELIQATQALKIPLFLGDIETSLMATDLDWSGIVTDKDKFHDSAIVIGESLNGIDREEPRPDLSESQNTQLFGQYISESDQRERTLQWVFQSELNLEEQIKRYTEKKHELTRKIMKELDD